MSKTSTIAQPVDQLPILPETRPFDPIVQCGVLYLGTAPTAAGLRGVDSIQQPFSHRYPVDGTNTVRGIDAVLSISDHGVQLAFTRQPYSVIYFPISSLIYCASLRFSIVENGQNKPSSLVDWRFMPLDAVTDDEDKHPPLFCAVSQRTQFLPGAECHCFIAKSPDAAIALVRTITEVYGNVQPTKHFKSPIFYQLDRYGRKLSEASGVIYISPATDDDSQLNRLTDETMARNYLFDPAYDGFFYRTDASLIEQWQLWDDDDLTNSRPHPPASPFGLYEGLYHDDTTDEIQRYLRHMDDEDHSCSCSSSTSSTSSSRRTTNSTLAEYSRKANRSRPKKSKPLDDTDQFNLSVSNFQTSFFEPIQKRKTSVRKKRPIIIEKVLPEPVVSVPNIHPESPLSISNLPNSSEQTLFDCHQLSDSISISYEINERGEKITKQGNRIVFMDVVQMNTDSKAIDSQSYRLPTSRRRLHRHRASKQIPMIDLQSMERLFNEKNCKNTRRSSITIDHQPKEQRQHTHHSTTPVQFEILERYFEDYQGNKITSNNPTIQSLLTNRFELTERSKQPSLRKSSILSSTYSSKRGARQHRSQSALTNGSSINYAERSFLPSLTPPRRTSTKLPVVTDEELNEFVSNIYGTAQSFKSTSSSTTHLSSKSISRATVVNPTSISASRYMQNSMNRNLLEDYRNIY